MGKRPAVLCRTEEQTSEHAEVQMKKLPGRIGLIAVRAQQDKSTKFTSLVHHINVGNLATCYGELKRDKACGIDGVTVDAYGENLEEQLLDLVERLKSNRYKPQPVRRVHIPKPGKTEKRFGNSICRGQIGSAFGEENTRKHL